MSQMKEILDNLFTELNEFKKISKKYLPTHNYYKEKRKKIKKSIKECLLKNKSFFQKNNLTKDILSILEYFLQDEKITFKDYKEKIDILEEKFYELGIEEENSMEEIIFDKKSSFDFYIKIKEIIDNSVSEIFIIEPYITEEILEVSLKDIPKNVSVKILTNSNNSNQRKNFNIVAKKFKTQHVGGFETRESIEIHDRGIFSDNNGWVIGQSLKDGAKNKPTYVIKLRDFKKLEKVYESIWNSSKKII